MEKVGSTIKKLRIAAGYTQEKLSKKLQVSQTLISHWEVDRHYPSVKHFQKLENTLGSLSSVRSKVESTPLSEWLKRERAAKGMSVPELAGKSQISTTTIYFIEKGTVQRPQESTIAALERALGEILPKEFSEDLDKESRINGFGKLTDFDPYDEQNLPNIPGIYVLYDRSNRPIYVGQSSSIARRISQHEQKFWFKSPIVELGSYIQIDSEEVRELIERVLIKFLKSLLMINSHYATK